jgi:hypothetical protein
MRYAPQGHLINGLRLHTCVWLTAGVSHNYPALGLLFVVYACITFHRVLLPHTTAD